MFLATIFSSMNSWKLYGTTRTTLKFESHFKHHFYSKLVKSLFWWRSNKTGDLRFLIFRYSQEKGLELNFPQKLPNVKSVRLSKNFLLVHLAIFSVVKLLAIQVKPNFHLWSFQLKLKKKNQSSSIKLQNSQRIIREYVYNGPASNQTFDHWMRDSMARNLHYRKTKRDSL